MCMRNGDNIKNWVNNLKFERYIKYGTSSNSYQTRVEYGQPTINFKVRGSILFIIFKLIMY